MSKVTEKAATTYLLSSKIARISPDLPRLQKFMTDRRMANRTFRSSNFFGRQSETLHRYMVLMSPAQFLIVESLGTSTKSTQS
jgi:hypothetical protein